MFNFDLHVHSSCSTGKCAPNDLLRLMLGRNQVFSITDHMSVAAYRYDAFKDAKLKGVELWSYWEGYCLDFLLYDFNIEKMEEILAKKREANLNNNHLVYSKLIEKANYIYGFNTLPFIKELPEGAHAHNFFAKQLRELRADTVYDETTKFFHMSNKPTDEFYVKEILNRRFSLEELVDIKAKTGGKLFVAHYPVSMRKSGRYTDCLCALKPILDGIEVAHPQHTPSEVVWLYDVVKEFSILVSAGTDWHGTTDDYIGTERVLRPALSGSEAHFQWIHDYL